MRRLILLALLAYALIVFGLAIVEGALLALALPFVIALAAAFLWGPEGPQLKVTRHLGSEQVLQDAPVEISLSITNEGPELERVLLQDGVPLGLELVEGEPGVIAPLAPGATVELTYTVRGKRGFYRFIEVSVTASDALGLFRRQETIPAGGQLYVLPPVAKLGQVAIRPQRTRPYSGLVPARRGGPGVEFFGLRESQPGDPLRWVDWKACARHPDVFYTKEFEQECVVDVSLILDARRRTYLRREDESLFEHAILATAALAQTFLNDGNRVGLLIFGGLVGAWALPGYGKMQRARIQRTLAEANLGEQVDRLEYLPTRLFPPASQIVLISPLLKQDLKMLVELRVYGYPILVISPDPVAFEGSVLSDQPGVPLAVRMARLERELLLRKLRQAGVFVVDWRVDQPLHQVVHAFLRRVRLGARPVQVRPRR